MQRQGSTQLHSAVPASTLYALVFAVANLVANAFADAGEGVPVAIAAIQQQAIFRQVQVTGTVTSPSAAQLSQATSGLVAAIHVEEGDHVKAGDALLDLDSELAGLSWKSAMAQVTLAEKEWQDAQRRLLEAQKLVTQQSVAKSTVDLLLTEVATDAATLERARADAAYQKGVLDRHTLKAPFSGVISRKMAELGEWVIPGQGVFELVSIDNLRLDFAVAEDHLMDLRASSEVEFTLNAQPGRVHTGKISAIVPVTTPGARTFLLRVAALASGSGMLPGMSAQATLKIATGKHGLVVPRDAILRYPDGRIAVWIIANGPEGTVAREQTVQTGFSYDGMVEVREGLASGASVIVRGNEALQNGQRVRIVAD